jgi:transcriptional regulator with XRE-family HTH domain
MTSQAVSQSPKKSNATRANIYFGGSMISGAQIRAGRAILRWSARELAEKSGLSPGSIENAESTNEIPANMLAGSLMKIKAALEKGGVEFDANGGAKLRKGRK